MDIQERNNLATQLEFLGNLFRRFEQQYNLVASLPSTKKTVVSDSGKKAIRVVSSGGSFIVTFILGLIGMLIPSLIIYSILTTIFNQPDMSLWWWLVIWFGGTFIIARIISKNTGKLALKKMDDHNTSAAAHNVDVDAQIAIAENNCNLIRQEISGYDLSWYPPDYSYSEAAMSFARSIRNQRANSLGEAVNIYEEEKHRNAQLELQRKQLAAAWTQCILQSMTIGAINSQGQAIQGAVNRQGALNRAAINNLNSSVNNLHDYIKWGN